MDLFVFSMTALDVHFCHFLPLLHCWCSTCCPCLPRSYCLTLILLHPCRFFKGCIEHNLQELPKTTNTKLSFHCLSSKTIGIITEIYFFSGTTNQTGSCWGLFFFHFQGTVPRNEGTGVKGMGRDVALPALLATT